MSKHPDNPYWCQNHDGPIVIHSREEWEKAKAAGHLTPEHALVRLSNVAFHYFGKGGSIGYDDEGFVFSMVAASIEVEGGIKLIVNTRDHPPPHVHIKLTALPQAKLRIRLDTGEHLGPLPRGITAKQFRSLRAVVVENSAQLTEWWEKYHGDPVLAFGH